MVPKENNYVYIDGANLHMGIAGFGWKLDYYRFRVWLSNLPKRTNVPIACLNDQKLILQRRKEKAPDADKTA